MEPETGVAQCCHAPVLLTMQGNLSLPKEKDFLSAFPEAPKC